MKKLIIIFIVLSILFIGLLFIPACSIIPQTECDIVAQTVAQAVKLLCAQKADTTKNLTLSEYYLIANKDTINYTVNIDNGQVKVLWSDNSGRNSGIIISSLE